MIKSKKGLFFLVLPLIIAAVFIITILILGLIFKSSINEGLTGFGSGITSFTDFLEQYGIWILVAIGALIFINQLRAIANFILGKFGVKI